MYRTTKKKLVKRVGISAAIAIGALATGVTVAGASSSPTHSSHSAVGSKDTTTTTPSSTSSPGPGQGCMGGAGGVVSALSATSITVTDPSGTATTYSISSSTVVTKDRATASLSDLAVGDDVHIMVTSGTTTASRIDIVQPSVAGKVSAVSGDTITITDPNGTSHTVIVSSKTTYTKDGASATLADVTVGSSIFAEGSFASSSSTASLDATSVGIGVGPGHGPGPGQVGGKNFQGPLSEATSPAA